MRTIAVVAIALAGLSAAPAAEQGGTQAGSSGSPELGALPQLGRQALQKEATEHEGRIVDVDRKTSGEAVLYVARLQNQDHSWKVKLSEDGKIVEIQEPQVAWEDVPNEVRAAALGQVQQGEMITRTIRSRRDGQEIYRLDLEKDGVGRDVAFEPSGRQLPAMRQAR